MREENGAVVVEVSGAADSQPARRQVEHGLPAPPSAAELAASAEAWRPFRSWVGFLLRASLGDGTAA